MAIHQPTCTDLLLRRDAPPFAFHPAIEPEFRRKIEHFLDEVRRRGYDELELAPPVCRMLWQHGWAMPPPVFLTLAGQLFLGAVCTGVLFGTGMTLFLGVAALAIGGLSALLILPFLFCFSAISFGTLFGVFYIMRTRYLAWILGVPAWKAFGPAPYEVLPESAPAAGCPRCGNDPLACHTHQVMWCDKCAHDLKSMGREEWRELTHAAGEGCRVAIAQADAEHYARALPRAESD